MEFKHFGKIPRLNRDCTITEKIDGTNGVIHIQEPVNSLGYSSGFEESMAIDKVNGLYIFAGSRTRWITPGKEDNHGFAGWVAINAHELIRLGPGTHYGEWWGMGINRGYDLDRRRFSLFNTKRWYSVRPACCDVVPILYEGPFHTSVVNDALTDLGVFGSVAAPDYLLPEGVVVYHHAANSMFKATIKGDEEGKHEEAHLPKVKQPRLPKDPSKGGRRKADLPYDGPNQRASEHSMPFSDSIELKV